MNSYSGLIKFLIKQVSDEIKFVLATVSTASREKFEKYQETEIERFACIFSERNLKELELVSRSVLKTDTKVISYKQACNLLSKTNCELLKKFNFPKRFYDLLAFYTKLACEDRGKINPLLLADMSTHLGLVSRCFLCQSGVFTQDHNNQGWSFQGCMISGIVKAPVQLACTAFECRFGESA